MVYFSMHMRTLHSGPEAQDLGDSRKATMVSSILMLMSPLGPLYFTPFLGENAVVSYADGWSSTVEVDGRTEAFLACSFGPDP